MQAARHRSWGPRENFQNRLVLKKCLLEAEKEVRVARALAGKVKH